MKKMMAPHCTASYHNSLSARSGLNDLGPLTVSPLTIFHKRLEILYGPYFALLPLYRVMPRVGE